MICPLPFTFAVLRLTTRCGLLDNAPFSGKGLVACFPVREFSSVLNSLFPGVPFRVIYLPTVGVTAKTYTFLGYALPFFGFAFCHDAVIIHTTPSTVTPGTGRQFYSTVAGVI